jgi:hypothetical protein
MTSILHRIEQACTDLATTDQPITFPAVAAATGTSRTTLYRNPELRTVINDHRARQRDGRTLTGLNREITHLRTALEAIAATNRNHEERLRHLENKKKNPNSKAPESTNISRSMFR